MQSVTLSSPERIQVRLGWDPKMSEHDRKRTLAKQIIAPLMGVEEKAVKIYREDPTNFGTHTQLFAMIDGRELPFAIRTTSFRAATVVAVAQDGPQFGVDLRDISPDDATLREMRRGSHLFEEWDTPRLLAHWTRVQAVREADGRGLRVHPGHVKLDTPLDKGWVPDRNVFYRLLDLSRDGWVVTLAYAFPEVPAED